VQRTDLVRLEEIMSTNVITTGPREDAERAWSVMRSRDVRHLVVIDAKEVVGVLSERDLGGRNGATVRRGRRVKDLMTKPVVTATPDTTLRQAANLMRGRTIGCLPVVDDGLVVGVVTITDALDQLGRGAARAASPRTERRKPRAPAGHHDAGGRARKASRAHAARRARTKKIGSLARPAVRPAPARRAG
jgi:acetoin utilization protein AcuB